MNQLYFFLNFGELLSTIKKNRSISIFSKIKNVIFTLGHCEQFAIPLFFHNYMGVDLLMFHYTIGVQFYWIVFDKMQCNALLQDDIRNFMNDPFFRTLK